MVLCLILLNAGVVDVAASAWLWPALMLTGRICEALAAVTFAVYVWPRVRAARHRQQGGARSSAVRPINSG